MNSMSSTPSNGSGAAVRTALAPTTETRRTVAPGRAPAPQPEPRNLKAVGYGLPCSKCRKYYAASLSACPVCKSSQRVSPTAPIPCPPASETQMNGTGLDEEKARLLREFKTKLYASRTPISLHQSGVYACQGRRCNPRVSHDLQELLCAGTSPCRRAGGGLADRPQGSRADHLRRGLGRHYRFHQDLSKRGASAAARVAQTGRDEAIGTRTHAASGALSPLSVVTRIRSQTAFVRTRWGRGSLAAAYAWAATRNNLAVRPFPQRERNLPARLPWDRTEW